MQSTCTSACRQCGDYPGVSEARHSMPGSKPQNATKQRRGPQAAPEAQQLAQQAANLEPLIAGRWWDGMDCRQCWPPLPAAPLWPHSSATAGRLHHGSRPRGGGSWVECELFQLLTLTAHARSPVCRPAHTPPAQRVLPTKRPALPALLDQVQQSACCTSPLPRPTARYWVMCNNTLFPKQVTYRPPPD